MAKQHHSGHSGDSTLNNTHVVSSVGGENKAQYFASCAVAFFSPIFLAQELLSLHMVTPTISVVLHYCISLLISVD